MVLDGTWGFAARRRPDAGRRRARRRAGRRDREGLAGRCRTRAGRAGRRAGARRRAWVSTYDDRPVRRCPPASRPRCSRTGRAGCSPPTSSTHAEADGRTPSRSRSSTPTWRARRRPSSGCGCTSSVEAVRRRRGAGRFETMRTLAPPVGRGLGVPDRRRRATGPPSWRAARAPAREKLAAPSVEAGTYDLVIDPSNLWLTIHESIGHATELDRALGLRGRLRRHVVRDPRPARARCATAATGHERHRRPHRGARPGHDRLRRRGRRERSRGTSSGTACSSATSSTARWPGSTGPRPVERLRVRRLRDARPGAADGERVACSRPPAGRDPTG